jgi:hypothetical protein
MVPCESTSRARLGLFALATNTVQFFKDFLGADPTRSRKVQAGPVKALAARRRT